MAVKTSFSAEDFQQILSGYTLGEFRSANPFKTGTVQTNIQIKTSTGQAVFRYYESRTKDYASFEMHVLEYLNKHNYPCPVPIKNKQGNYIDRYKGKPFGLLEVLEGEHQHQKDGKPIAEALGKLHALTLGYKPVYAEARDTYDPVSCLKSAAINALNLASVSVAKERLSWLKTELNHLHFPQALPKGVCHCDTHPSNFLYQKGTLIAILDFDDASYIHLLYDLANLVFFWAWPDKGLIDFEKTRELIRIYETYRNLTQEEKEHLFDMLHMVNFMGIGWFIHHGPIFTNSKRKTDLLNTIGRQDFYSRIF